MLLTRRVFLFIGVLLGLTCGDVRFSLHSCAKDASRELLTFSNVSVFPDPVVIPGNLNVFGTLKVNRTLQGPMSLEVKLSKLFLVFWVKLPCINGFGSCVYRNLCRILQSNYQNNNFCPSQLIDNNIPCTCPIEAGTYTMSDANFTIPVLQETLASLSQGDYKVSAKLIDESSGEVIACQKLQVTIAFGKPKSCSGFFCDLFG